MKTLSLRIRGAKADLEDAGLEVDNMCDSTSELQQKLLALTGGKVNIMVDENNFKNTTQILREMSTVWDDMTDINRAAALELLGGKRQANVLSAIIKNFNIVEDVIETSSQAQGSALAENEKYLDSIQGKVELFTNSLQTMWMNLINSDVVKFFVDLGTTLVQLIDKLGIFGTVASAVFGRVLVKGISSALQYAKLAVEAEEAATVAAEARTAAEQAKAAASAEAATATTAEATANAAETATEALDNPTTAQNATVTTAKATASDAATKAKYAEAAANAAESATEAADNAKTTMNLFSAAGAKDLAKKTGATLVKFASTAIGKISLIGAGAALAYGIYKGYKAHVEKEKQELEQEVTELQNTYNSAKKEIDKNLLDLTTSSDTDKYETLDEEFTALTAGVDKFGNNLSLTSDEYERYKQICETIVGINPSLLEGYDSATEAIGNQADALRDLIELKKEEARRNARDYTNDENLGSQTENAVNQYKDILKRFKEATEEKINANVELRKLSNKGVPDGTFEALWNALYEDFNWLEEGKGDSGYGKDYALALKTMQEMLGYSEENARELLDSYFNELGNFNNVKWAQDFSDEIEKSSLTAGTAVQGWVESYNNALDEAGEELESAQNNLTNAEENIDSIQEELDAQRDALIETFLQVPQSMEEYDNLSTSGKSFITDWIKNSDLFKIDENTTEDEVLVAKNKIKSMIKNLVDGDYTTDITVDGVTTKITAQDILDRIVEINPAEVNWSDYQIKMASLQRKLLDIIWNNQKDFGFDGNASKTEIAVQFGLTFTPEYEGEEKEQEEKLVDNIVRITGLAKDEAQKKIDELPAATVQAMYKIEWKEYGNGDLDFQGMVNKVNTSGGSVASTVKSYNELNESTSTLNDILSQSSEIFQDNIKLSDELGGSLKSLIGDSEDWADAVDENNGYLVKNASLLRKLVTQQKSAQKAIISTSKAQAQLQYQKTVKQIQQAIAAMQKEVKAHGLVSNATLKTIEVLRSQLTTLKETIQQYALLEVALTDAANAYSEYEQAKERDARLSYDESFLEALKAIDNGLLSGKVGTEEFEYAVKLLVPEEVYKAKQDLGDIDGMVRAIHDYCDGNPLFANWFTVDKENGDLSITTDNIRSFIKDGIDAGVFVGDEGNFQLADGIEGIEQFTAAINAAADGAGVTEGAVLAMLSAMEDYDGTWGNVLTDLQTSSIDREINKATDALDDALKAQEDFIKNGGDLGGDEWKELCKAIEEARKKLEEANDYAIKNVGLQNAADTLKSEYTGQTKFEGEEAKSQAQSYAETIFKAYNDRFGTGISTSIKFNDDGSVQYTEEQLKALQVVWQWYLEHPASQLDIQLAVNKNQEDIDLLQKFIDGGELTEEEKEIVVSIVGELDDKSVDKAKEELQKRLDQNEQFEANYGVTPNLEQDEDSIIEKLTTWEAKGLTFKINVDTTGVREDLEEAGIPVGDSSSDSKNTSHTPSESDSRRRTEFNERRLAEADQLSSINLESQARINYQDAKENREEIQNQLNAELSKSPITLDVPASFSEDPIPTQDPDKVNELSKAYEKAAAAEQVWGNIDINSQLADKAAKISELTQQLQTLKENNAGELQISWKIGEISEVVSEVNLLLQEKEELGVPTEVAIELVQNDIKEQMDTLAEQLSGYGIDVTANITDYTTIEPDTGEMSISIPANIEVSQEAMTTLQSYVNLANQNNQINVYTESAEANISNVESAMSSAKDELESDPTITVNATPALSSINSVLSAINNFLAKDGGSITLYANTVQTGGASPANGTAHSSGSAHALGTAHSSGNWALKHDEKGSLVGELGQEIVCRNGQYFTVGDSGAEFVNLKRGDIIFNHRQTEALLKHGYVTSRGKMFAGGTAHATGTAHLEGAAHYGIVSWSPSTADTSFANGQAMSGYPWSSVSNAASAASSAAGDVSDAADETKQAIDFIEYKLEEIEEIITKTTNKLETYLDNTSQIDKKKEAYDALIEAEKQKMDVYTKAIEVYKEKADNLLSEIPEEFRALAQNGGIAITDFVGEDESETASAIEEYREWAQKVADAEANYYASITEIAAKALEKFNDIADDFVNVTGLNDRHNDSIQNQMDLLEEQGQRLSTNFYNNLIAETNDKLDTLRKERDELQRTFDVDVKAGNIKVGSDEWYEAVNAIYDVDDAIVECQTDVEGFQNAINDLYWDNLDKLINKIDSVQSEIENLYDILSDDDKVVDDVGNWTSEGIAALGMLTQQMESARFKSEQYGEAISQLEKDYKNGLYSTDEYNEKLAELKENQWAEIKAQEQAKKSIVELNKTRIEAAKGALQKEIDKYSELISKKKEELQLQKD